MDEAHIIKNNKCKIYKALNAIQTKRRIALTGSPLQNNLMEYYNMVNFVKPRFLGTEKEFRDRFESKIKKGQDIDATYYEKRTMRYKTYLLHKKLEEVIHRKDNSILLSELSKKREFVIVVKMTLFQKYLYKLCISSLTRQAAGNGNGNSTPINLFSGFQELLRIWNHPANVVINWAIKMQKISSETAKNTNDKNLKKIKLGGNFKSLTDTLTLKFICKELKAVYNSCLVQAMDPQDIAVTKPRLNFMCPIIIKLILLIPLFYL